MKQLLCTALALTSIAFAADQKFGRPLTIAEPVSVATLLAKPDPLVGQTVQVKGTITEVCEAMGCWMNLTDDAGHLLRIDVGDASDISFPKDSIGKTAVAEGKLAKLEMSKAEVIAMAKEEAAEAHRKFDAKKIKSGKTIYQIAGVGAVILD
jgi:hypothetical protein